MPKPTVKIKQKHSFSSWQWPGLLFVAPALLYMFVLVGYPILYNIMLSFKDVSVFNLAPGIVRPFNGFENYKAILGDETMWPALRNTVLYTLVCLVFQFTLGLAFALFFNKKFFLARFLRGLLLVSWMMPVTVTALLFKYLLSPDTGAINVVLQFFKIISQPVGWLQDAKTALWGPIIANVWIGVPFNMLLISTGLSGIPHEIYESASLDGAGIWNRFYLITLPLLKPAIRAVLILGFVYTFKVFDLIFVMTGGGPVNSTEVLATFAYRQSFTYFYFGQGAALANILLVILSTVSLFYLRLIRKEEPV